jgi:hypothetical protein
VAYTCNPNTQNDQGSRPGVEFCTYSVMLTLKKFHILSWAWWLTLVIPAVWGAEVRRIVARGQPKQKVSKSSSQSISQCSGPCLSFQLCRSM